MTRAAESITVEFDGEDGVWAPTSAEMFFDRGDETWTPERVREFFSSAPKRGLAKLFGGTAPMMLSTALPAGAMRYTVRRGLLYPAWAAMSVVDEEVLSDRALPDGCHFEIGERALYLRFDEAEPLSLAERLGLIRCTRSVDSLHWYVEGENRFKREPERYLSASEGADGHV
jgi:hypothetical protein